jgi:hypothetical protein
MARLAQRQEAPMTRPELDGGWGVTTKVPETITYRCGFFGKYTTLEVADCGVAEIAHEHVALISRADVVAFIRSQAAEYDESCMEPPASPGAALRVLADALEVPR